MYEIDTARVELKTEKLGVALVGLGEYSSAQLAPALMETKHSYLAGIVSGSPEKRQQWKEKYQLEDRSLYSYANFDSIKNNEAIHIVYITLPNALHMEYVIRAARAGKHVICEKPMALSVWEAQKMVDTCKAAGVKLSMGYRLHFDPFHREIMRIGQQATMGTPRRIIARNSMDIGQQTPWRINGELAGGGPLMNNGIYCVQAALYITGEMPIALRAQFHPVTNPEKFKTVEEGIQWEMEFPNGAFAVCDSSYTTDANLLRMEAANGWVELEPAYEYKGLKGLSSEGEINFPEINQQAAQIDDFAQCIINNLPSRVPGEMGLRDMKIIEAIYESARTNHRIELQLEAFETLIET